MLIFVIKTSFQMWPSIGICCCTQFIGKKRTSDTKANRLERIDMRHEKGNKNNRISLIFGKKC